MYYWNKNYLYRVIQSFQLFFQNTYTYGEPGEEGNRAGRIKTVSYGKLNEERWYGRLGETIKVTRTITHDVPANSVSTYTTCYKYDNLGRMTRIDLPGGEVVNYAYDAGGLLKKAVSVTSSGRYEYVKEIQYDHFGQRTMISYGNGSTSHYTYDPVTRRLLNLTTSGAGGETYPNIT